MEWKSQEYSAASVKPRSCYSTLPCYGAHGNYKPIIPPVPVTTEFDMFDTVKPHNINHTTESRVVQNNCLPYKKFGQ